MLRKPLSLVGEEKGLIQNRMGRWRAERRHRRGLWSRCLNSLQQADGGSAGWGRGELDCRLGLYVSVGGGAEHQLESPCFLTPLNPPAPFLRTPKAQICPCPKEPLSSEEACRPWRWGHAGWAGTVLPGAHLPTISLRQDLPSPSRVTSHPPPPPPGPRRPLVPRPGTALASGGFQPLWKRTAR